MSNAIPDDYLAEIQRSMEWGDFTSENTEDWTHDLLREVVRLRAALARVTEDSILPAIRKALTDSGYSALPKDAENVLRLIRSTAEADS